MLLPAADSFSKNEYITGVWSLIVPRNVVFASRLSKNPVCIYLFSKKVVDEFVIIHKGISIKKNRFLEARRLITPAKRII